MADQCDQVHPSESGKEDLDAMGKYDKPTMAPGSHTFAEGIIDYYHLTGARRVRDVALASGLALGLQFQLHRWGLSRNTGWGLLSAGADALRLKTSSLAGKGFGADAKQLVDVTLYCTTNYPPQKKQDNP